MTASTPAARRVLCLAIVCAIAALSTPASASAAFGDAKVLAPFPAKPGFPEGVAVRDGRVYAAGAASLGTTASGPSAVIAYDRATGAVVRRYDTVGENLLAEHGDSSIAFDGQGRLYVLNTQIGTYRLNTTTGVQTPYSAPFPHLKPCLPLLIKPPCSPNPTPISPLPNDIAFAPNGDAYVTDSFQATIWRIPKGGGTPQIWFQSTKFASPYIGVNGLRLNPAGTRVYVTVTIDLQGRASLYSLPLTAAPAQGDLRLEHRFAVGDLPDGIAFGATGQLFVSMASPTAPGVLVLNTDGTTAARIKNPTLSLTSPFDGPANIAFDGAGRILMTNHAPVTGLALRKFSIADVDVTDNGAPLFKPMIP
jgi:sugar lactone lactonase YvrE